MYYKELMTEEEKKTAHILFYCNSLKQAIEVVYGSDTYAAFGRGRGNQSERIFLDGSFMNLWRLNNQ